MIKKYNADSIRTFQLFKKITSVDALDCFTVNNYIIYIIPKKSAPRVIGREGKNIIMIKNTLKKDVKVIEESDSAEELVRNFLFPIKLRKVEIMNEENGASHIEIMFLNRNDRRILLNNQQELLKCLKEIIIQFYPEITDIKVL